MSEKYNMNDNIVPSEARTLLETMTKPFIMESVGCNLDGAAHIPHVIAVL